MSVQAMARVWDLDLPHAERLVLLALADHADHVGDNIYPSIGLIAWKTGYSSRQVQRIIKSLIQMEILCVIDQPEGQTTIYRMDLKAGTVKEPYLRQNVRGDKMSGVTKRPPKPRQNVTPTPDIAMSPKPPVEPSRTTRGGEAAPKEETATAVKSLVEAGLTPGQAMTAVAKQEWTKELLERVSLWSHEKKLAKKNPGAILCGYTNIGLLPDDLPPLPEPVVSRDEALRRHLEESKRAVNHATFR